MGIQIMSALDVANYLQLRIKELNYSTASAARSSGLSRQTWYKLLSADIEEAKLSTLIRVAETLYILPASLIALYFTGSTVQHKILQYPDPLFSQNMSLTPPHKGF